MRCSAYCTCATYEIAQLFQFLQTSGASLLFRDIVHIQPKDETGVKRDIFYFSYGTVVFWGFSKEEELKILDSVKSFEKDSLLKYELDVFTFAYGGRMAIKEDQILLHKKDFLVKLSISFALVQSVKLIVFEEAIDRTIENSKQIPKNLAERGRISLSRKQTSKKIGYLYLERNYINLHSDILDTPEFFWDHAELEPFYRRMIHYLDVNKRAELLNRRLTLLHELYEIMGNELNHRHSSRLEWTIIILILIEILLAVSRDLLHLV
jgi:uncharacterized Rmd1/YagE family protein